MRMNEILIDSSHVGTGDPEYFQQVLSVAPVDCAFQLAFSSPAVDRNFSEIMCI